LRSHRHHEQVGSSGGLAGRSGKNPVRTSFNPKTEVGLFRVEAGQPEARIDAETATDSARPPAR
jgi:hypothetical protein